MNKKLLIVIGLSVTAVLIATVGVFAALIWPSHDIVGTGTVTVNSPPPPPPPPPIPSVLEFGVPSSVDFSGSVTSGQVYSVTKQITVTNTSTLGTDGADCTLHGLSVTAIGLPTGWTLTGSASGLSVAPGASTSLNLGLSSVTGVTATTPLSLTVTVQAN